MAVIRSSKPALVHPKKASNRVLKWLACIALIVCATGLAVAIWTASQAEMPLSDGQIVVEPGAEPSPEEIAAAEYLAGQGHRVRLLPRDPSSPNPQPDAQLDNDDFSTEIKTVGNITSQDISGRLAGRIREGLGQAPSVVVDARKQAGLTVSDIERALDRATNMARVDKKLVKRIRVIGPNGEDVIRDFTGKASKEMPWLSGI